jgi:GTP-binding protein EngB required for normal cell division
MMLDAFRERRSEVTQALQELATIAGTLGAQTLQTRIGRELITKLKEDRFHLVVVGEFNHGKSSFVNALLGTAALAVGVTPTTAAIHHLRYAEAPEATVVHSSGERKSLAFVDVKKFAVGGAETLESVDHIELGYPAPILKEGILLVDTPGVNDLSQQRADITYSYIPRADAVLFLLDAGQILKESERVFLQEKLLKASRDKIIFVITKWDILSSSEQAEALGYAKKQLSALVSNPVVFPISAETALAGNSAESGMPALITHLTTFLSEERGRIQLGNALQEAGNVAVLLSKGLEAKKRSVTMDQEELERRIALLETDLRGQAGTTEERRARVREDLAGIKTGARKDLERFVDEVTEKLPGVIDAAKREDLGQYLPAFLEETFRTWAEAESKELSKELEALAEKTIALMKDDAAETTSRVASMLGTEVKLLDVQVDTLKYDIGVGALFAAGLLGLVFVNIATGLVLMTAAPVLAFFVKDRVDAEYKKRAKELGPQVLRSAAEKIAPRIEEMIDAFGKRLDDWVVTAGEELHREVLEVLHAARTHRAAGAFDNTAALAAVAEESAKLTAAQSTLHALERALHVPARELPAGAEEIAANI